MFHYVRVELRAGLGYSNAGDVILSMRQASLFPELGSGPWSWGDFRVPTLPGKEAPDDRPLGAGLLFDPRGGCVVDEQLRARQDQVRFLCQNREPLFLFGIIEYDFREVTVRSHRPPPAA
jgi:hypothetical protein